MRWTLVSLEGFTKMSKIFGHFNYILFLMKFQDTHANVKINIVKQVALNKLSLLLKKQNKKTQILQLFTMFII